MKHLKQNLGDASCGLLQKTSVLDENIQSERCRGIFTTNLNPAKVV